jgi:hypothetical protein
MTFYVATLVFIVIDHDVFLVILDIFVIILAGIMLNISVHSR